MEARTAGLILRTRPLTETSLIVHWLTRDFGRLSTVAKGALRPKSPFRGKLDLFYLAEISFYQSRRSDLHSLRELSLRATHPALRVELGYLQQAAYFARLIELTTETNTPLPGWMDLLLGALQILPQAPPRALTVFAFEFKVLVQLGLQPDLARTSLSPGAQEVSKSLVAMEWDLVPRMKLSDVQRDELDRFLQVSFEDQLGRAPEQRAAALDPSSFEAPLYR